MRLLDLYCGAGGAAMGYHRAGFDVVGVDIAPQPRYPFTFVQADALDYLTAYGHQFDAIHASPPCQDHSALCSVRGAHGTGWMLEATRDALIRLDVPWVIENVPGAPMPGAVVLCGTEFGLSTDVVGKGRVWLRRHRLFESSVLLMGAGRCHCYRRPIIGVYGHGDGGHRGWKGSIRDRRAVMGIDWMTRDELAQAVPPAYTEHVGEQLVDHLSSVPVAS